MQKQKTAQNSQRNKAQSEFCGEIQSVQSEIQHANDNTSQTRREFIANSSKVALAGMAIGAMASISPLLAKSAKAQNKGDTMNSQQTWYITGASGGLGFALAKYLLEKGDKVAVTSRKKGNLEAKFGELSKSENFLALTLTFDKNIDKQVAQNIAEIKRKFGRIDNVVNNAGYGLLGFVEEVSEKQLREQFEVNVFTPFLVAQNALKIMRPQAVSEGGSATNIKARIYNISSIGGFRTSVFSTPYCMSKFALSAFSEGLKLDLAEFGIGIINVMPTGFRTEFLGKSMNVGELKLAPYAKKREEYIATWGAYSGKQPGDPEKFGKVIYDISRMQMPPLYLFMGDAAFSSAEDKIVAVQSDMKATRSYAGAAVDFANPAQSAFDKR